MLPDWVILMEISTKIRFGKGAKFILACSHYDNFFSNSNCILFFLSKI